MTNTNRTKSLGLYFTLCLASCPLFAGSQPAQTSPMSKFGLQNSEIDLQVGGFWASQGQSQFINIASAIGDQFTVQKSNSQNYLLGLGYLVNGYSVDKFNFMLGVNAFYLANTSVNGTVIQENLFTNLSYNYSIVNYPIYLEAKTLINTSKEDCNLTLDLGIGPNIIQTRNFSEQSIDNGITIPDRAFSGQTNAAFSVTAGAGVRYKMLEVGYRFFYLGRGQLASQTTQILDNLNTGNSYANAVVVSVVI